MIKTIPICKHLNSECFGHNRIGYMSCPQCNGEVPVGDVLTNWIKELTRVQEGLQKDNWRTVFKNTIGPWLSAALSDETPCKEFKRDIEKFFDYMAGVEK